MKCINIIISKYTLIPAGKQVTQTHEGTETQDKNVNCMFTVIR